MKKIRFKVNVVVNFIIEQNGKVLLMKRSDGFFKGGYWVLPAGHIDGNETLREASVRELKEELNIDVSVDELIFLHAIHSITPFLERIDFYFKIKNFSGCIVNKELNKCDEIKFFDYGDLPEKNKMSLTTLQAFEKIRDKEYYSEFGFVDKKNNVGFSDFDKFSFESYYNILENYIQYNNINKIELDDVVADLENNLSLLKCDKIDKKNVDETIFNIIFKLSLFLQVNNSELKMLLYKKIFDNFK